jgi:hypothetical protein
MAECHAAAESPAGRASAVQLDPLKFPTTRASEGPGADTASTCGSSELLPVEPAAPSSTKACARDEQGKGAGASPQHSTSGRSATRRGGAHRARSLRLPTNQLEERRSGTSTTLGPTIFARFKVEGSAG